MQTAELSARELDIATVASLIINGKGAQAAALAHTLCERERLSVAQLGEELASAFSGEELGAMLAIALLIRHTPSKR